MARLRRYSILTLLVLLAILTPSVQVRPAKAALISYNEQVLPNQWIATGSPFNLIGDDRAKNYTLPFLFNFYDHNYTQIFISTNGLITFNLSDTSYVNCSDPSNPTCLPSKLAIAPLWTDLQTNLRSDTDVFTAVPDSDHVLVRWKATAYGRTDQLVNFEAILGRDSTIRFNYGPSNATVLATEGISKGNRGDYYVNTITTPNNMSSYYYTPIFGSRPLVAYTTSPNIPWLVGETIIFDASPSNSSNGPIVVYKWNFGDGTNTTTPLATHTYPVSGTYIVKLFVKDSIGATNNTSFTAKVGLADARMEDIWPDRRSVSIAAAENLTVSAHVINIQGLPVSVRIEFQARSLRGATNSNSSQTVLLATRDEAVLSATLHPPTTSGTYFVSGTVYYTPRDPAKPEPGWIVGEIFPLRVLITG